MIIKIEKHKEYTEKEPKTVVFLEENKKVKITFDKEIDSMKISKFLFELLETNEDNKIYIDFDEEENKDQKFIKYVRDLFQGFAETWNDKL